MKYVIAVMALALTIPCYADYGDFDGDGSVTILDIQREISAVLGGANFNVKYDINLDGSANVVDIQMLVRSAMGLSGDSVSVSPLPHPNCESAGATITGWDGRVYLIGGAYPPGVPGVTNARSAFVLKEGGWEQLPDTLDDVMNGSAGVMRDGSVLVGIMGYPVANVYRPSSNSWERVNMPIYMAYQAIGDRPNGDWVFYGQRKITVIDPSTFSVVDSASHGNSLSSPYVSASNRQYLSVFDGTMLVTYNSDDGSSIIISRQDEISGFGTGTTKLIQMDKWGAKAVNMDYSIGPDRIYDLYTGSHEDLPDFGRVSYSAFSIGPNVYIGGGVDVLNSTGMKSDLVVR